MSQRTKSLFAMVLAALAAAFFWGAYDIVVGTIPRVENIVLAQQKSGPDGAIKQEEWKVALPFPISRSWDVLFAPIAVMFIIGIPRWFKAKLGPWLATMTLGPWVVIGSAAIWGQHWMALLMPAVFCTCFSIGKSWRWVPEEGLAMAIGTSLMVSLPFGLPIGFASFLVFGGPLLIFSAFWICARAVFIDSDAKTLNKTDVIGQVGPEAKAG